MENVCGDRASIEGLGRTFKLTITVTISETLLCTD